MNTTAYNVTSYYVYIYILLQYHVSIVMNPSFMKQGNISMSYYKLPTCNTVWVCNLIIKTV